MKSEAEQPFKKYESQIKTPYAELGDEGADLDKWGSIKYRGEWINIYSDPKFIRDTFSERLSKWLSENKERLKEHPILLDVGGGDGSMLNVILKQLADAGFPDVKGVDLDADPSDNSFAILNEKKANGEYSQNLKAVRGDFLHMPLQPKSVDMAVSRMSIQYLTEEDQRVFLKNIHDTLKAGGIFILQFPSSLQPKEAYNEIWEEITRVIAPDTDFKRSFPMLTDLHNRKVAKEAGFDVHLGMNMSEWNMSVSAFAHRFHLNDVQTIRLEKLFKSSQKKYSHLFETVDGKLCLKSNVVKYVLQKPLDTSS